MRFDKYFRPDSVQESSRILCEYGSDGKILAGGTDVVPMIKSRKIRPKAIIDITNVASLKGITETDDSIHIGALTKLVDVAKHPLLRDKIPIVCQGAGHISSMQVRNIATIGGNSCSAIPSADSVPGLIVSDAIAVIYGPEGERELPIVEFFAGPGKTNLKPGEILTEFIVPFPEDEFHTHYEKFSIRGDSDVAIVGIGAGLSLDGGLVKKARVALGAVGPTPIRAYGVEEFLVGKVLNEAVVNEAAELAVTSCTPISDKRASKWYRQEMVRHFTKRVLHTIREYDTEK